MSITKIIILSFEGTAEFKQHETNLDTLQGLVGGYIESISLPDADPCDWAAFCNEEGKLVDLPGNERATTLLYLLGGHNPQDLIRGDVILVGINEQGETVDVPDTLIELVRTIMPVAP